MRKKISPILSTLFGKVHWSCPPWLNTVRNTTNKYPSFYLGFILILALTAYAINYTLDYYNRLPKNFYTTAVIEALKVTPNDEKLIPQNVVINFGKNKEGFLPQSVAPLDKIGKMVNEGIHLKPAAKGTWTWTSDSQLTFVPENDWPANQTYTINFNKTVFSKETQLDSYNYTFKTQPFEVAIKDFKLYQDPVHAQDRHAVATLHFNYPVESISLEQNTLLTYTNSHKNAASKPISFSYTFDVNKRIAYLKSAPLAIDNQPHYLELKLNAKKVLTSTEVRLKHGIDQKLLIPDNANYLKITSATGQIIRNAQDHPEQILTIETSLGVNDQEFNQYFHAYLLPKRHPNKKFENENDHSWLNPGEVNSEVLKFAQLLTLKPIPSTHNFSTLHSFKITADSTRFIYIQIDKKMPGLGHFELAQSYRSVLPVPKMPKEIGFLHQGSLLAISGENKLSVISRGIKTLRFDFARVLADDLNQLVSQTQGNFNNPYFINPSFNQNNISLIHTEIKDVYSSDLNKPHYTALDFSQYLAHEAMPSGPQGLFLLKATEWNKESNYAEETITSRLVLVTDMALIVKDNQNHTHDVYITSISKGLPVNGANVVVLGKNGLPILEVKSDAQGHANIPDLSAFTEDKEPVAYIAKLGQDVSFIPYNNLNRQLNFSKFDTGGIYSLDNSDDNRLEGYLFSDRGIYRPNDDVHIGMIIKQSNLGSAPKGIPLQIELVDPKGTLLKKESLELDASGLMSYDLKAPSTSPTGQYHFFLYSVKDNHENNLIGSTTFTVSEFQPDKMRIKTRFSSLVFPGWNNPNNLNVSVNLENLFGLAAANKLVKAKIMLMPQSIKFKQYADYIFHDPAASTERKEKSFTETLPSTQTNAQGNAVFDLKLQRFDYSTYKLLFFAEGFETNSGKSVNAQSEILVSTLSYFIGYKPDGDLTFIKQNDSRAVNLIAIDPKLQLTSVKDLNTKLYALQPINSLIKKPDGTFEYQSVTRENLVHEQSVSVNGNSDSLTLDTKNLGDYVLKIFDKENHLLNQVKYSVIGDSKSPLTKNAELDIKLNKKVYQPDEDIEVQIVAPYSGSGLITIERDKVYVAQWFQTDSNRSVQKIHIPANLSSDAYVNVNFVRSWNSDQLFISPLSFNVVPFTIDHSKNQMKINLEVPQLAKPGETIKFKYSGSKNGKAIIYAVDEGILQSIHYITPDPLGFFFQKHALEVLTQQTVDQILPKFNLEREMAAVGGDSGDESILNHLNPFKRKTESPVVFWSGIIDIDSASKELSYQLPDYFNGSLRVIAVAVSADTVGVSSVSSEVRGDLIITSHNPLVAAPGDRFQISASILNNNKGSGPKAEITFEAQSTPGVEILSKQPLNVVIPEGEERTVQFDVKATQHLGSTVLSYRAKYQNLISKIDSTISIRPLMPYTTLIKSGRSTEPSLDFDLIKDQYPEYQNKSAIISSSPMILLFGLQKYLDNYPYGCTEQLVSKAFPLVTMNKNNGFIDDLKQVKIKIQDTIDMLGQRQMTQGGFSYWPGVNDNQSNDFATIYAMHFLTEVKSIPYTIPDEIFQNGMTYLKNFVQKIPSDLETARLQAYAIYILTRNDIITSDYINNLQDYFDKHDIRWHSDISAVYLASAYQLMQSSEEAAKLVKEFQKASHEVSNQDFYNENSINAQYLYLIAKHFPELKTSASEELLLKLVEVINNNELNTILSSYISLAINATQETDTNSINSLSIDQSINNQFLPIANSHLFYQKATFAPEVERIRLNNPEKQTFYYQLFQSGFSVNPPLKTVSKGLEIFREYRDVNGKTIDSISVGEEIEVHIQIRSLNKDYYPNIAIVDLLPGGFELVPESLKLNFFDYADAREDRINFFGYIDSSTKELSYKLKAINAGSYQIPPIHAESMYDPNIYATGVSGKININTK